MFSIVYLGFWLFKWLRTLTLWVWLVWKAIKYRAATALAHICAESCWKMSFFSLFEFFDRVLRFNKFLSKISLLMFKALLITILVILCLEKLHHDVSQIVRSKINNLLCFQCSNVIWTMNFLWTQFKFLRGYWRMIIRLVCHR